MSAYGIIAITGLYLGFLFLVAGWGKGMGRAFLERYSGYFYGLGLGVYATAWTFYGSIGRAATHGLDFLAIYLGLLKEISRICSRSFIKATIKRSKRDWAQDLAWPSVTTSLKPTEDRWNSATTRRTGRPHLHSHSLKNNT